MAEGHCYCKAITVSIPAVPEKSALCYCSNCRVFSSAPFNAGYVLPLTDVEVKDPTGVLKSYEDSNTKSGKPVTRQFCGTCGSPIRTLLAPGVPMVVVRAGLFGTIPQPSLAIFEEQKPEWVNVIKASEEKEA